MINASVSMLLHVRYLTLQRLERVAVEAQRLGRVQRDDASGARGRREHRELAEVIPRPEDAKRRGLAESGRDAHREVTLHDEVERVARVAVVEHDLVALEPSPSRACSELGASVLVESVEQMPSRHGSSMSGDGQVPGANAAEGST